MQFFERKLDKVSKSKKFPVQLIYRVDILAEIDSFVDFSPCISSFAAFAVD